MYASESISSALGRAWAEHRNGKNEAAVAAFERVLKDSPDDIDANFGLGLSQRALGWYDQATQTFQKTAELVGKALAEIEKQQAEASNVTNPEHTKRQETNDRLEMLARMCQQRIAEIEALKQSRPPIP